MIEASFRPGLLSHRPRGRLPRPESISTVFYKDRSPPFSFHFPSLAFLFVADHSGVALVCQLRLGQWTTSVSGKSQKLNGCINCRLHSL